MPMLIGYLLGTSIALGLFFIMEISGRTAPLRLRLIWDRDRAILSHALSPLGALGRHIMPHMPVKVVNLEQKRLASSGKSPQWAIEEILGLRILLGLGGCTFGGFLLGLIGGTAGGVAGFFAPTLWFSKLREGRSRQARNELVKVLDLLVVYTTAGVPLAGSLDHLAKVHKGILSPYLARGAQDIMSGKPASSAFRPLMDEMEVEEISCFVQALARAERLGTPLTEFFLRESKSLRRRRSLDLQYRAGVIPLKLTMCTTLFFLPSIIVLVIFPNILAFTSW